VNVDPFFVDELLSREEREIRDRVRAFSEEEVVPIMAACWERAEFPFGLVPKVAGLGICGDTIKGYGCAGLSAVASGLVAMELARGDGSVYTFFGARSGFAMNSIAALGSEEQKEKWLPQMARMEKIEAFALTEPNHGSDAVLLETSARREGDGRRCQGYTRGQRHPLRVPRRASLGGHGGRLHLRGHRLHQLPDRGPLDNGPAGVLVSAPPLGSVPTGTSENPSESVRLRTCRSTGVLKQE
jgi:Acyl-CoA dehydrogenase, N-terminal domain